MFDYFYNDEAGRYAFYRIPKLLSELDLSSGAEKLYGLMLDRMELSFKNGWKDDEGRCYIYFTHKAVKEALKCADHKAVSAMKELEGVGLIQRKKQGQGKPTRIYVMDFARVIERQDTPEAPKSTKKTETCKKRKSRLADSATLDLPKSQSNNTEYNNIEYNQSVETETDEAREEIEKEVSYQIEADILREEYDDAVVDACVATISDAYDGRLSINIKGKSVPGGEVAARYRKLQFLDVEAVLDVLKTIPHQKVKNPTAYLAKALYHARDENGLRSHMA